MRTSWLVTTLALGLGLILAVWVASGEIQLPARAGTYTVDNTNDSGPGSLRYAMLLADGNPDHDTIDFDVTGVITLESPLPDIRYRLTISGPGADQLAISGDNSHRVFAIKAKTAATITGITVRNGLAHDGGGIWSAGNLQMSDVRIFDNEADEGGGIFVDQGSVTASGVWMDDNISGDHGGGMFVNNVTVTLSASTLSDNYAGGNGGGVYVSDGSLNLSGSTLYGNEADRSGGAVYVDTGSLTLSGGQVENNTARGGGGVYVDRDGSASMTEVTLFDNSAEWGGGICFDSGTLTLSMAQVVSNSADYRGGGLFLAQGRAIIIDTQVSRNTAEEGGGMAFDVFLKVTLSGTQVFSNTATSAGGGVRNYSAAVTITAGTFHGNSAPEGGGLVNAGGTMTLTNSTLNGNTATTYGGGVDNQWGEVGLYNCTLVANRAAAAGGIRNQLNGILRLKNTIVADSMGGDCAPIGTIETNINNLIEDGTCSPALTGDPGLGPLADNGGPTPTMAPAAGSPVIDAGDDATCEATDQRGIIRPQGAHCDIGAYETSPQAVVNSLNDPGDGNCNAAECTLREAVTAAAGGDVVGFEGAPTGGASAQGARLAGGTIQLGSVITIEKDLTIDGSGLEPHVRVSGQGSVQVFRALGQVQVALSHLDIVDGSGSSGGGIEITEGSLAVSHCTFSGNEAGYGGAISSYATTTVSDCTFLDNHATDLGGAIHTNSGRLTIRGSTFTGNSCDRFGGGICNIRGEVNVANSTFYSNSAQIYTGGIHNFRGLLTVSNCTLSGNGAPNAGGLLNTAEGILHLKNSIVADSPSGGDCENYGSVATNLNNLIEDGTCSPALSGDPVLGTLADNGGETRTMAIGKESPAFDAGDDTACEATDQRGASRPQWDHCDIGAYESERFSVLLPMVVR